MTSRSSLKGHLGNWIKSRGLHSDSADARIRAIERLAVKNDPETLGSLIEALGDSDPMVRTAAAVALGERRAAPAVEPLASALNQETDDDVFASLAGALAKLDRKSALRTLMGMVDDDGAPNRAKVAALLRNSYWSQLDDTERARVAILQGAWEEVAELGAAVIPVLENVVHQGTQHTKREAAEVLGMMGTPEAHASLGRMLLDSQLDPTGREIAAWALKKFYWQDLSQAEHIRTAILDEDWPSIIELGEAAITPLCEVLPGSSLETCRAVIDALKKIGGARAVEVLGGAVADRGLDVSVCEEAVRALGSIGDESAVPLLVGTLRDESWVVRDAGAASLEALGWTPGGDAERAHYAIARKDWEALVPLGGAAIEPLVDALRYGAVGMAAARALQKAGPAGLEALLAVLRDSAGPVNAREVAARVLAEAGDTRAIEAIHGMLGEHDSIIRQVAVWALTRLGWEPANDREKALVAIANEDWDELAHLGAAAVEPLLALTGDSLAPEETARALRCVLELSAAQLSIEDLRAIVALGSIQTQEQIASAKYDGGIDLEAVADAKAVRELANAELTRRGVKV